MGYYNLIKCFSIENVWKNRSNNCEIKGVYVLGMITFSVVQSLSKPYTSFALAFIKYVLFAHI